MRTLYAAGRTDAFGHATSNGKANGASVRGTPGGCVNVRKGNTAIFSRKAVTVSSRRKKKRSRSFARRQAKNFDQQSRTRKSHDDESSTWASAPGMRDWISEAQPVKCRLLAQIFSGRGNDRPVIPHLPCKHKSYKAERRTAGSTQALYYTV